MMDFFSFLSESLLSGSFIQLTLSNPTPQENVKNIYIKPVVVQKKLRYSFVYRYETKDITKNYTLEDTIPEIKRKLTDFFYNASLFTESADLLYQRKRKTGKEFVKQLPPSKLQINLNHNKIKNHLVDASSKYLHLLGISNDKGEITKQGQAKFKQINKYIEIIDGLIEHSSLSKNDSISIVDMGCGKGYLSFALYDYLIKKAWQINLIGVELREELVRNANLMARELGFKTLKFVAQNIESIELESINVLIALHACDIATDMALFKGIEKKADIIVVAPCCHKEIRQQLTPQTELNPILKHGILAERHAELLTDGIRSLLLESEGYSTKVFEFVSNEHTGKNIMITASHIGPKNEQKKKDVELIKVRNGISKQYLDELLKLTP